MPLYRRKIRFSWTCSLLSAGPSQWNAANFLNFVLGTSEIQFKKILNIDECVRETNITKKNNPCGSTDYLSHQPLTSDFYQKSTVQQIKYVAMNLHIVVNIRRCLQKAMSSLTLRLRLFANTVSQVLDLEFESPRSDR